MPKLAVGRGRVFLLWSRYEPVGGHLLVTSTVDGQKWTPAAAANTSFFVNAYPALAVGTDGVVYVAWDDPLTTTIHMSRSLAIALDAETGRLWICFYDTIAHAVWTDSRDLANPSEEIYSAAVSAP